MGGAAVAQAQAQARAAYRALHRRLRREAPRDAVAYYRAHLRGQFTSHAEEVAGGDARRAAALLERARADAEWIARKFAA